VNELIQVALEKHAIHAISTKGDGYSLYCIDIPQCNRFFIEVYEEMGEIVTYHANQVYKHTEIDESTWNALDEVQSNQYIQEQIRMGIYWQEEANTQ
jgi:hypothetical protein